MTIKQGTLVEITMNGQLFGHRFVIGDSHITDALYSDSGDIIDRNVRVYHAPFNFPLPEIPNMISVFREKDIRIINPDGDVLSDKSYEELIASLSAGGVFEFNEHRYQTESEFESDTCTKRKSAKINVNDLKPVDPNSMSFIFGSNR